MQEVQEIRLLQPLCIGYSSSATLLLALSALPGREQRLLMGHLSKQKHAVAGPWYDSG
jgi:hypothetical protein